MSTNGTELCRNHVTMDEITSTPQIAPISSSRRVSMEEYYKQENESSDRIQEPEVEEEPEEEQEPEPEIDIDIEIEDKPADPASIVDPLLDSPPSYDASVRSQNMRSRLNIQPREDEGRETLPGYSAGISLENVFMRKMELQGAIHRASDRNWHRVLATLQGTLLTFHKFKGPGLFGLECGERKGTPDMPAGTKRGSLLGSYNLQHAEVGIAADYVKKNYVIRVRAEADQFLLSCIKIETFVSWLQSLFIAIDISMPLDERQIPKDQSIPRSRRRRRREARDIQVNDDLIRAQEELIRTHYPNLATPSNPRERVTTRPSTAPPTSRSSPPRTPRTPQACVTEAETALRALQDMGLIGGRPHRHRMLHRRTPNPTPSHSFCPDTGKWRPEHAWSPRYDMLYAKKCMGILTSCSPRKSNYLIMKGKQWIVDWSTGSLTRCEPPEYGEEYCGRWKIDHNGSLVKA
ncbi:16dab0d7-a374-420d-98a9-e416915c7f31 [Sclerotinia trifoliorum]|uniref:16dab0d7-a374-420d-98a9-e416915c7f31 n=1 Tax=Sclerotinia trifoliorum TaxID=28548 RepID=A0A8H2VQF5_9HELO|nr:16dab0d7-a374-420d-98a9-e416915c7f31 [Sclerotinia trifoliorum]